MSFLRGAGIVILGVLFLVTLIFSGFVYTIQNSLEYENLKVSVGKVILENVLTQPEISEDIESALPYLEQYCKTHKNYVLDTEIDGLGIDLSCESVKGGEQTIVNEIVSESVDQFYYQEYDCTLVECLNQEKPLYIISEDFKDFLKVRFYISILVLIVLFALIFLLAHKKYNAFFIAGALTIVSGLPFLIIKSTLFFLEDYFYGILKIFFSNSKSVFLGMLVIGIMLIIIGVVLKLVEVGFKISGFFRKNKEETGEAISKKEVKAIVNKEIAKSEIKELVKKEITKTKTEVQPVQKTEVKTIAVKDEKSEVQQKDKKKDSSKK